jgi:hypothetical protein
VSSDEDRRKFDEAFKFRIVEQQAEIKTLIAGQSVELKSVKEEQARQAISIAEIRYAMWGGPKESDVGLLEKHRRLVRNWAIIISVSAFVFAALGRIISPLYDKMITDWAFNSPSERWMRETQQPKVRVYKIYRKKELPEPPEESPTQ